MCEHLSQALSTGLRSEAEANFLAEGGRCANGGGDAVEDLSQGMQIVLHVRGRPLIHQSKAIMYHCRVSTRANGSAIFARTFG